MSYWPRHQSLYIITDENPDLATRNDAVAEEKMSISTNVYRGVEKILTFFRVSSKRRLFGVFGRSSIDCPDSKWVGDILRKLGGQEVELDFGQQQMFKAISQDSEWMDERTEKNRGKQRKRMTEYRERKKSGEGGVARCSTLQTNVAATNGCSIPSIHPTIHPTIHPAVCESNNLNAPAPARTREDVPTEETVLAASAAMGVPTWYVLWWYAEMTARDWTKVDGSPVGNRNWRPVLKSWWNRDEKDAAHLQEVRDKYEPKVLAPKVYQPEDWALCKERCKRFCDGGCGKGIKVPPQENEYPYPPEECPKFLKL